MDSRINRINLGFYGWSKKKCPFCNEKLKKLSVRQERYCRKQGCLYRMRFYGNDTHIEAAFNGLVIAIVAGLNSKKTTLRPDVNAPPSIAKEFNRILSLSDIKRFSKAWCMS